LFCLFLLSLTMIFVNFPFLFSLGIK